jgi:hypothetical protein
LRELLSQSLTGFLLHLGGGDRIPVYRRDDTVSGATGSEEVGAAEPGNEGDYHQNANNCEQSAKHDLLDRARGLQKSNHFVSYSNADNSKWELND